MKLPEVLEAIDQEMPEKSDWIVAVLTRQKTDGTTDDGIKQHPIFDVSVDHDDAEINLVTDQESETPRSEAEALSLGTLLSRLTELKRDCSNYSVFSASSFVPLNGEFDLRYDAPLVGVARNHEAQVYGFLQFPADQWEGLFGPGSHDGATA